MLGVFYVYNPPIFVLRGFEGYEPPIFVFRLVYVYKPTFVWFLVCSTNNSRHFSFLMFRKGPFVFSFWVFPKVVNKLTLFHNVEMMRYVFKRRQRHVSVLQNSNCFVSSVFSVYTNINTAFSFWVLSTREATNFPLGVLSYIDNLIPFRVFSKVVNRPFTFRVFFTYINTPFPVFVVFYKRNSIFLFWRFLRV